MVYFILNMYHQVWATDRSCCLDMIHLWHILRNQKFKFLRNVNMFLSTTYVVIYVFEVFPLWSLKMCLSWKAELKYTFSNYIENIPVLSRSGWSEYFLRNALQVKCIRGGNRLRTVTKVWKRGQSTTCYLNSILKHHGNDQKIFCAFITRHRYNSAKHNHR